MPPSLGAVTRLPGARRRSGLIAAALLLAPLHALHAWAPATQVAIATTAAKLAPPDLARQIEKRPERFRAGVMAAFDDKEPTHHYRNLSSGALDRVLLDEVAAAVAALRQPMPFDEVVYRLGRVAHWVADANNPLNAAGDDPDEGRYFADYLRYAASAQPRFAPVFYAGEPAVDSATGVKQMVLRALHRGRDLYPFVGEEYRRTNFVPGVQGFDDRSTAFGIAALSYSHAVTDLAHVLRYIWVQGGGADPRERLWAAPAELLLLPKGETPAAPAAGTTIIVPATAGTHRR